MPLTPPNHVAIIMDGNGRWAASHGMSRSEGHRAGTENLRRIIEAFIRHGVRYLTLFAFSTENWRRPDSEIQALLEIVDEVIRAEVDELHREDIRLRHIGRLDRLPTELRRSICDSIELTKHNSRMTLCVAFDYGGRAEIIDAVRSMIADEVKAEDVSEELLRKYMYTNEMPDPDLIIRTSGEQRLSNFLIWQAAYAEYYTTAVYWPDFDEKEVDKALKAFGARKRRFGKVS
ncbi:MAG: di-trans,poly-cis-decaprenylcistransferase [Chloroflexi bacterium]|nr:di-trans,poly-cis-decaprenylcistransferase [Chloroflexota bacterium]